MKRLKTILKLKMKCGNFRRFSSMMAQSVENCSISFKNNWNELENYLRVFDPNFVTPKIMPCSWGIGSNCHKNT